MKFLLIKIFFILAIIFPLNSVFQLGAVDDDSLFENFYEIKFDLSNETLLISSKGIYDASYNYSVFLFSNQTDSNLMVLFNDLNTTLLSNETFFKAGTSTRLYFKLVSKGNSTGYYSFNYNICCGAFGAKFSEFFLLSFPILAFYAIFRRNQFFR